MGGRLVVWFLAFGWLAIAAPALAQDDLFEEAKEAEPEEEAAPSEGGGEQLGDEERPPGEEEETTEETDAPAEAEPVEDSGNPAPVSIGVLLGYGISLEDSNPWGFGFGLRGGYNIDDFYVGARFAYHLGETYDRPTGSFSGGTTGTEEVTVNEWDLGAEAGYDIHAGSVIIRPELGLGFASLAFGSSSELNPYLGVGAALLVGMGDAFYLGLDARFQAIMAETSANAVGLFGTLGMRF